MNPLQNKWESRRIEHHFYAEIVADIKTRNQVRTSQQLKTVKTCNLTTSTTKKRIPFARSCNAFQKLDRFANI